jgi:hypothetical protein
MDVLLSELVETLAYHANERGRFSDDVEFIVYSTDFGDAEGREIGRVLAVDEDEAMELAIESWVDCGGEYTEGLSVLRAPFTPEVRS